MTERSYTVGVVGNPNCGKTTLFNALTGARQHVGNWPGVTVEKKTGEFRFSGNEFQLVDLPGTYSLESSDDSVSLDEKVARDYVASHEAQLIINILDAANIERNLYLTSQLLEMQVPMILVLNMMDSAEKRGIKIDIAGLAHELGCAVIPVTASTRKGIKQLKQAIQTACKHPQIPRVKFEYPVELEQAIAQLCQQFGEQLTDDQYDSRWLMLRLLESDTLAESIADAEVISACKPLQRSIEEQADEEIDILTADARYGFVNRLTQDFVSKNNEFSRHTTEKIDRIVLNRFLGIPIFLMVMYAMFMFTINIGSAFIDFFDLSVGAFLVDGLAVWLQSMKTPEWIIMLLANGVGGGIQVVATFIPIVGFLFIFLSALEDSGYMSRAAFVMDRFMCMIGLPGKSFVPMIVGFGCNVPAIMATRTLENRRDRILTNLMNPFMSCGARLPVYALFAAAFFPVGGQNIVFGLYLFGIMVAVLTGLIMRHTLFKGDASPFVMELPPYHLPTLQNIGLKTWERLQTFIFNAGKVIVPMVLVLNVLNAVGTDGSFGQENSKKSVLSEIGRSLTPVFEPMGIEEDNWPATVGIFTGVLAKEAVVGTLNALYSQIDKEQQQEVDEDNFVLMEALSEAWQTIPDNLVGVAENLLDPLGLNIGSIDNLATAAEEQEVDSLTFSAMRSRFDGKVGAFAYLLFVLLYTPCVAATAAIFRETGTAWSVFVVCWTTGLAYITATLFYQLMTFNQHPQTSMAWVVSLLIFIGVVLTGLKITGNKPDFSMTQNDSV